MSFGSNFWTHLLLFAVLALAVCAVISGYREEEPRRILRGTARRFVKFTSFALVIALGMLLVEWAVF